MKLIRSLDEFPDTFGGGALTIGNFDGVHRGHAVLIDSLKQMATTTGGPAVVFTFDPHPVRILRPEQTPPPLTWTNRKADLLNRLGVDVVIAYPTDKALLELSYQRFFEKVVCSRIKSKAMVEGPNFNFGKNREGTVDKLSQLCQEKNIELVIVHPLTDGQTMISSSHIRNLIRAGDVQAARQLLTQPYRIRGMVTHGAARGKQLGFPTANLDAIDTLIPAHGVYVGRAHLADRYHWAAINVGPNPTFGEHLSKVEVHILDFESSIYGQVLEVDFVERLRDIQPFDSQQQLMEQLQNDVALARAIARNFTSEN